jgi:hypothetical protein
MKTTLLPPGPGQTGSALMLTMVMTGVALAILAGAMNWSANSTRLTHRSIQYTRSVAAAEAATEKVLSQMARDCQTSGETVVRKNADDYRKMVPTTADSLFWKDWEFTDGSDHHANRTYVQGPNSSTHVVLTAPYAGLQAFASTWTVVSHARDTASLQRVVAGVLQEVQLALIPIFQYAMYSSGNMEVSCGQPFSVTGRVHSNGILYVEPASDLTFKSDVSAVGDIFFLRDPLDTRTPAIPGGTVVYEQRKDSHVPAMSLPIGTNNTPEAIREIVQPPPSGEDPNSPIGRLRYYNQADMILTVSDTGIAATSGSFNNFKTTIPTNEVARFVTITNSFRDAREEKTVKPIDINIGALKSWSETNKSLRGPLNSRNVSSVYVVDRRTLPGTSLAAVRVVNGRDLPADGLTVATARPLYVLGHYNQANSANLGSTNTTTTRPASLVADAVTILSANWTDAKSTLAVASRTALPTTVNAAILTGVVETTLGKYSGGMENFPRFLETWGLANIFTYNGSMIKMFPSLYATNVWGKADVYDPPKRNWAYDVNFNNVVKLPPVTPSLQKVIRGQWATVAPDKNVAAAVP